MTKFLIIGPSGIGKSTALNKLSEHKEIEVFDLDRLLEIYADKGLTEYQAEIGWRRFFEKSKEIIESLKSHKNIIVIAVGSGSFEDIKSHNWYLEQNTISLVGDIKVIYPRSNRQEYHPTIESYELVEYSGWRTKLYSSTKYKIDVTNLNEEQIVNELLKIIL